MHRRDVRALPVRRYNAVLVGERNVWAVPELFIGLYNHYYKQRDDGNYGTGVHRPEPVRWLHRRDIWAV